jgi:hypothetical protein
MTQWKGDEVMLSENSSSGREERGERREEERRSPHLLDFESKLGSPGQVGGGAIRMLCFTYMS